MEPIRGANDVSETSTASYEFSFAELLRVVWSRVWVVALVTILVTGPAVGYSLGATPTYEASAKLLVGQERQPDAPSSLGSDVQGLQQITQTVAEAADSRPIAETVIEEAGLPVTPQEFLRDHLTVEQVGATQFIELSYRDTDPQRAQLAVNTMGEVFAEQISEVSASTNALTVTLWEPAAVPQDPVSPNLLLNTLIALVAGTLLGVGLALLLEHLDDSWRSPEEVEQVSGLPNLGLIPQFEALPKGKPRKAYATGATAEIAPLVKKGGAHPSEEGSL